MKITNKKIIIGIFVMLLITMSHIGAAKTEIFITQYKGLTRAEFDITGADALRLWKYMEESKQNGGFINSEITKNSTALASPVMTCFRFVPEAYGHGDTDDHRVASIKESDLYKCHINLGYDGLIRTNQ